MWYDFVEIRPTRKDRSFFKPYLIQEKRQIPVALDPLREHVVHHGLTGGPDLHTPREVSVKVRVEKIL